MDPFDLTYCPSKNVNVRVASQYRAYFQEWAVKVLDEGLESILR